MTGALRVGQVADAAGVNLETLRYYERRGLLARPDRASADTGSTHPRPSPSSG